MPDAAQILPPALITATPLVEARALTLNYAGRPVLEHVDLTVAAGEIVTLIGPNGSGKTTLVRTLLGLQAPDSGSVHRRPGLSIGYLPQRFTVEPVMPLTVRRLLTLTRRHGEAALGDALDEVGGVHLLDAPVQGLSGGELQRVLLARALLRDPDLLVLDEPVQGVDYKGEIELYALIARIRDRRRCGVLMVSHDLHLVMAATDRVVCLNGHVCCSGAPEAVSRDPSYIALFGRQVAEGLAVYTHAHDHEHDIAGHVCGSEEQHR